MKKQLLVTLGVLPFLALAACGGDDDDVAETPVGGGDNGGETPTVTPTADKLANGESVSIAAAQGTGDFTASVSTDSVTITNSTATPSEGETTVETLTWALDGSDEAVTETDVSVGTVAVTGLTEYERGGNELVLSDLPVEVDADEAPLDYAAFGVWMNDNDDINNSWDGYGAFAFGDTTDEMPTAGTATYSTAAAGYVLQTVDGDTTNDNFAAAAQLTGQVDFDADFTNGTVSLDDTNNALTSGTLTATLSMNDAPISDMGFSRNDLTITVGDSADTSAFADGANDLDYTGSIAGMFYGDDAAELAGTFKADATAANDEFAIVGGFAGARGDITVPTP